VVAGTDRPSPSWGGSLFSGSSPVRILMIRVVVWVSVLSEGVGVGALHTRGRCKASVPKRRILNTTRLETTQNITRKI
jgi:hypothetical protein